MCIDERLTNADRLSVGRYVVTELVTSTYGEGDRFWCASLSGRISGGGEERMRDQ